MRRGGLGRGLSALIPGAEESTEQGAARSDGGHRGARLINVPVTDVHANPRQPRKAFDAEAIEALAASIRQVGLLQPVVVRPGWSGRGYELVAGERRLRAATLAGLPTVPAILRDDAEGNALQEALIENLHREDLSPLELASAFQELLEELDVTQEEVATRLGCSRAHVANTIRLLSLPADVQRLLADGRISAGHARALLGLPDEEACSTLALRIAAEGLSVRQVESLVKAYAGPRPRAAAPPSTASGTEELEERLMERLGTRVRVTMGRRRGRIVIDVTSAEELERVAALLERADVIEVPDAAAAAERATIDAAR